MPPTDSDSEELERLLAELTLDPENYSDAEAEAFDAGLARLAAMLPPGPALRPLPDDLAELYGEIRLTATKRATILPNKPPVDFEGYEAHEVRRGGMGLVIKARDPVLERWVALKLWIRSGARAQAALLAEARTLAKLSHPNVVTVYGTGQWRERVYFVMEWVDGVDVHEWLQQARPWQEVREVFVSAGDGLAAAHEQGIQHRDLKPANLLIGCDGRVRVADFGVAECLDGLEEGAEEAFIVGTPCYMAPERLRGGRGDARSDQYSFCAALWRGLYGVRPHAGESREELLASMASGGPRVDPAAVVPGWLNEVVRRGLAENPGDRFGSMDDLVEALLDEPSGGREQLAEGWTAGAERDSAGESRIHSPGWVGFLGGMVLTGLAVVGVGSWRSSSDSPPQVLPPPSSLVSSPTPAAPCAVVPGVDKPAFELATEICTLIRHGHLESADRAWTETFGDPTRAQDDGLTDAALIVGATFTAYADSIADVAPDDANLAARKGLVWLTKAAADARHEQTVTALRAHALELANPPPSL